MEAPCAAFIGRANELLSWFHKRIFAELFVGKMLVRKHGDEIERFRSGIDGKCAAHLPEHAPHTALPL